LKGAFDPRFPVATLNNVDKENSMLGWAMTFLIVALVAAALGFGALAGTAAGIAKILFLVFLVLFVVSLIFGRVRPVA
jgi:uncharacterized membrane protein YtjA (UPF0391 family)